jgi:hypothetical protein
VTWQLGREYFEKGKCCAASETQTLFCEEATSITTPRNGLDLKMRSFRSRKTGKKNTIDLIASKIQKL